MPGRTPKVPSAEDVRKKFLKRVKVAGPDYEFRVNNPLRDWLEEFKAAKERIKEGLTEMAEEERFVKHAEKKGGTERWKSRTTRKGPSRWKDETPRQADEFKNEIAPYLEEIARTPLGEKRKKGDPANVDARVKPIVIRLHAKKVGKKPEELSVE